MKDYIKTEYVYIGLIIIVIVIVIVMYYINNNMNKNVIPYDISYKSYAKFNNKSFNMLDYLSNRNLIYSINHFYTIYPDFDYYKYRYYKKELYKNKTELDVLIDWYHNDKSYDFLKFDYTNANLNTTNVIIYTHNTIHLNDGGTTVQYYLAQLLDMNGVRVRIIKDINDINRNVNLLNNIFDTYHNNDYINIDNSVVIYCEAIGGNPLKAPKVVRWMLAELGANAPYGMVNSWGKDELIYYFNSEQKFKKAPEKVGSVYKLLTTVYINPSIKIYNKEKRDGYCHAFRKMHLHKKINMIHPSNSFEITRNHSQEDYIEIFNNHKYFISYDPLTFLSIIAALCGCISIVYPIEGVTKERWLEMTAIKGFFNQNKINNIYGIAYGNTPDEIEYAENTIHLVKEQWDDFKKYENKLINNFIYDINHFNHMKNTIANNYINIYRLKYNIHNEYDIYNSFN
jgi:hypothetical protein